MVERSSSLLRSVSSRFSILGRSKCKKPVQEASEDTQDAFVTKPIQRQPSSSGSTSSQSSMKSQTHRSTVVKSSSVACVYSPPICQDLGLGYSSIGYEQHHVPSRRHSRTVSDPAQMFDKAISTRSSSLNNRSKRRPFLARAHTFSTDKNKTSEAVYECILDGLEDLEAELSLLGQQSDAAVVVEVEQRPSSQKEAVSTLRSSGSIKYATSPLPRSPYTIVKQSSADAATTTSDVMQNVKDHMKAQRDLLGFGPFYAVARGWKKGVYASQDEALRQIRGFPGPAMLKFDDVQEALLYVEASTSPTPSPVFNAPAHFEMVEERLERSRIFSGAHVDPLSSFALPTPALVAQQ